MRYAAIKENDIVDGEGVCVSFGLKVVLIGALDVIILELGILMAE